MYIQSTNLTISLENGIVSCNMNKGFIDGVWNTSACIWYGRLGAIMGMWQCNLIRETNATEIFHANKMGVFTPENLERAQTNIRKK